MNVRNRFLQFLLALYILAQGCGVPIKQEEEFILEKLFPTTEKTEVYYLGKFETSALLEIANNVINLTNYYCFKGQMMTACNYKDFIVQTRSTTLNIEDVRHKVTYVDQGVCYPKEDIYVPPDSKLGMEDAVWITIQSPEGSIYCHYRSIGLKVSKWE